MHFLCIGIITISSIVTGAKPLLRRVTVSFRLIVSLAANRYVIFVKKIEKATISVHVVTVPCVLNAIRADMTYAVSASRSVKLVNKHEKHVKHDTHHFGSAGGTVLGWWVVGLR